MKRRILAFLLCAFMLLSLTGCFSSSAESVEKYTRPLSVHFIDVGQADCSLIVLPDGRYMLIDAGNNGDGDLISEYLNNLNITKIDYLVATHPHEDHIGSIDTVIQSFTIGKLYMPDAKSDTKTYRDVISAIEENGVELITAYAGTTIYADENMNITAVAPVKSYSDLNNSSIVIRLTYKNSSFLFTGDAEELSEKDITATVSADVLKVGHHGSNTSTSDAFLSEVDPMYAVISCGRNNKYGHPHSETLEKLENDDVTIYRTDTMGTLVCTTTGLGPADYKWETK